MGNVDLCTFSIEKSLIFPVSDISIIEFHSSLDRYTGRDDAFILIPIFLSIRNLDIPILEDLTIPRPTLDKNQEYFEKKQRKMTFHFRGVKWWNFLYITPYPCSFTIYRFPLARQPPRFVDNLPRTSIHHCERPSILGQYSRQLLSFGVLRVIKN